MRADLEISLTRRSFALPLPALFTSFDLLRMCVVLCKPGFAPSSIYTADNLGSPQVEPNSKPWLDLTLGDRGLVRYTFANLGHKIYCYRTCPQFLRPSIWGVECNTASNVYEKSR